MLVGPNILAKKIMDKKRVFYRPTKPIRIYGNLPDWHLVLGPCTKILIHIG